MDHEVIRRRPDPPRTGPGRPPTPTFDVNPGVHAQNAQNLKTRCPRSPGRILSILSMVPEPLDPQLSTPARPSGDGAAGGR